MQQTTRRLGLAVLTASLIGVGLQASSHREAPGITKTPKLDGSDFYLFNSYEAGRSGFVTLLANYLPLQDAYGGPNFFTLDPDAVYELHVDNDGDAKEDLTFQFRFKNTPKNISLNIGGKDVAVPLVNVGPIGPNASDTGSLNVIESYTVTMIKGDRRYGQRQIIRNAATGSSTFIKPADRIGDKSFSGPYSAYADQHIYPITIPGCAAGGKVFVGQRREGFVVNLSETFDLVNDNPLGARNSRINNLADKNVTTLGLDIPAACLARPNQPIIGGWTTTSSIRDNDDDRDGKDRDSADWDDNDRDGEGSRMPSLRGRSLKQVSRLGNPLVNEVVIGLKDKDAFNRSEPKDDAQFARYVTNPTLPALLQALFGVTPPTIPRNDLVAVFLTGVTGLNMPPQVKPAEMLRLNTSIPAKPAVDQKSLGVLEGDLAGFPNGRRPGDDVVDIALRAAMGVLLPAAQAPSGSLPYTDGALVNATIGYTMDGVPTGDVAYRLFRDSFPYLQTPVSGSPAPTHP